MEREVTYNLQVTLNTDIETGVEVLAMESDYRYVLEIEPGLVLRVD